MKEACIAERVAITDLKRGGGATQVNRDSAQNSSGDAQQWLSFTKLNKNTQPAQV